MDSAEHHRASERAAWCETLSFAAAMASILALGLAGALALGFGLLATAAALDTAASALSPEGVVGLAYWRRGIR